MLNCTGLDLMLVQYFEHCMVAHILIMGSFLLTFGWLFRLFTVCWREADLMHMRDLLGCSIFAGWLLVDLLSFKLLLPSYIWPLFSYHTVIQKKEKMST